MKQLGLTEALCEVKSVSPDEEVKRFFEANRPEKP